MSDIIVKCPHCGATRDITDHAPWNLDDPETYECEKCGKPFEVEAEYKFLGHKVTRICPECWGLGDDCNCDEDGRSEKWADF